MPDPMRAFALVISFAVAFGTLGCAGRDVQALDFADLRYPYPTRFADLPEGKVAYVVDGPESPRGTIVLLHGWLGDLRGWAAVMPFLARDYRVVALDFPGYGKSDKSRDRAYGVPLFADATHHLLASLGVERATWMGHSLGGQVAAYAALHHSETVERVVLVDASGLTPPPDRFALFYSESRLAAPGYHAIERMLRHVVAKAPENVEASARERYALTLSDAYPDHAHAQALAHRSMSDEDLYYQVAHITAPTLIVWGAEDPIFPEFTAQEFNRRIAGSLLAVIPACGHLPQVETPDSFNRAVGEFLGMRDLPTVRGPYVDRDPAEADGFWHWFY